MKIHPILTLLLSAGITANTSAAPKPPSGPQDVNVVNTPNVTVTNPQTSVTVDNTSPIPVNVQNQAGGCSEFQFVGVSTATYNGGSGIRTYTEACQNDFPGSRMCSSEEYVNTLDFPQTTFSDYAWIRPTLQPVSGGSIAVVQDISGVSFTQNNGALSCQGWRLTGNSDRGLSVNTSGAFIARGCDLTRPIACCAPAP